MAEGYINGFQAVRLDVFGRRIILAKETFDLNEVGFDPPAPSSVTTDADGLVPELFIEELNGPGAVIEFSHATYPEVFLRTV